MKEVQQIIDKNKEAIVIPDGIAVIAKDNKIIVFNEAASRISGFEGNEIISQNCNILFENCRDELKYINESLETKRPYTNLATQITLKNGTVKNVLASITPIINDDNVLSVVFVFRDTKEMLTMAEELEEKTYALTDQKNKLDAIFNSNIEGTFTIDHDWNVTSFNVSAEKITGYKKKEAVGKKCWEIFNSTFCRNGCHMEQTMMKGKSTMDNELEIVSKRGRKVPIRVNSAILENNKNEKIGAVETFIDITEIKNLSSHLDEKYKYENIVGKSKELRHVISIMESVAQTSSTVLITGESGTGKELAARAIHLNSSRRKGPFTAVNCSAFAETLIESELFGHEAGAFTGAIKKKIGRFELAHDGTLFLDEIGDLSIAVQTKLLRVLETREFERVGGNKTIKMDTRIIAATNKDLSVEISKARFREDLFYRINVINIHLPPLRKRINDLPLLLNHFLAQFNQRFEKNIKRFSTSAFNLLAEYGFPGNIRELENIIEHAFILCGGEIIQPEHLPKRLSGTNIKILKDKPETNSLNFDETEKQIIITTLKKNMGSKSKTAKELGIHTSTLWRKIKKLNISL